MEAMTKAVGHLRIVGENETPKDICRCPVCDNPIPQHLVRWHFETRTLVRNGMAISLTPMEAKLFNILWLKLGTGQYVSRDHLNEYLYADREDGGALTNTLSVRLAALRPRLKSFGIEIKAQSGHYNSGYWMVLS